MRRNSITVSIVLALSAAACGGGKPALEKKFEQFKQQVCACKDEACADAVNKQATEYTISALKDMKESEIAKLVDKLEPLERAFNACYEKAAGHPPRD